MTPENFCYWLQGRMELLPNQAPTQEEWEIIRSHLKLVFAPSPITWPHQDNQITPVPSFPNWVTEPSSICSTGNDPNKISFC